MGCWTRLRWTVSIALTERPAHHGWPCPLTRILGCVNGEGGWTRACILAPCFLTGNGLRPLSTSSCCLDHDRLHGDTRQPWTASHSKPFLPWFALQLPKCLSEWVLAEGAVIRKQRQPPAVEIDTEEAKGWLVGHGGGRGHLPQALGPLLGEPEVAPGCLRPKQERQTGFFYTLTLASSQTDLSPRFVQPNG